MNHTANFAATAFFLLLGACASNATPETTDQHSSAVVQANAPAADITGTWVFDLEASDVAKPIREKCAAQANGDQAKQQACWSEISTEAKQEMIRFSKPEGSTGRAVWSSFAENGKNEVLFLEVPVDLSADGTGHVLAKIAGTPKGMQAEMFSKGSTNQMRIEVVETGKTIAMHDPKKGRLVYTKRQ